MTRYQGLGVLGAVDAVRGEITGRLRGQEWHDLAEIDAALIELDGMPDKARLGANAIAGVSMACARGLARADGRELWEWLSPPGGAAAAGPALQCDQRRGAPAEPAGFPGVHDRAAGRWIAPGGGAGGR